MERPGRSLRWGLALLVIIALAPMAATADIYPCPHVPPLR